jgi:hypothetical protein
MGWKNQHRTLHPSISGVPYGETVESVSEVQQYPGQKCSGISYYLLRRAKRRLMEARA